MRAAIVDREACIAQDRADPLASFRAHFLIDEGLVYLDGNSLGALCIDVRDRLRRVVDEEWGSGLVRSWNDAGWIGAPQRIGDKIGRLIGAAPGQTVVADSTSVNLYKLLAAALAERPGRTVILTETDNFPTDLYIAHGLATLLGAARCTVRKVAPGGAAAAVADDVAVVMLTHVHYQSGRLLDLRGVTAAAHAAGALMLWDLSHSTGPVPVDVDGCDVDFAVGCGYKYLNGGPGAPAFAYVARRLQASLAQPLLGWLGHAEPFTFSPVYVPAAGVGRLVAGTPPILGALALEAAVDLWLEADPSLVRNKSQALGDSFIALADERLAAHGVEVASPRDAELRGSQVSLRHPAAAVLMAALVGEGVIGDFRAPDHLRFGLAPLYTRHTDVYDAVDTLDRLLAEGRHLRPAPPPSGPVT